MLTIAGRGRYSKDATTPKMLDALATFDLGAGLVIEVTISTVTGLPTKVGWRSPQGEVRPLPADHIVRISEALAAIAENSVPDDASTNRTAAKCIHHGLTLANSYEARCAECERAAAAQVEADHG